MVACSGYCCSWRIGRNAWHIQIDLWPLLRLFGELRMKFTQGAAPSLFSGFSSLLQIISSQISTGFMENISFRSPGQLGSHRIIALCQPQSCSQLRTGPRTEGMQEELGLNCEYAWAMLLESSCSPADDRSCVLKLCISISLLFEWSWDLLVLFLSLKIEFYDRTIHWQMQRLVLREVWSKQAAHKFGRRNVLVVSRSGTDTLLHEQ